MDSYELAVFIGRFQIFHTKHLAIVLQGLQNADRIAVMIGSAGGARSHRNPFSFEERAAVIKKSVEMEGFDPKRVLCQPVEDTLYNDILWMSNVRKSIAAIGVSKIALIGYNKDHTSYYLNMFPEWDSIDVKFHETFSSTQMREVYFSNAAEAWLKHCNGDRSGDSERDRLVPTAQKLFLEKFLETPDYKAICEEYSFVLAYRAPYMSLPHPPIFVTADAVVTQSGHILLVRRKGHPGKGLLALPGGFVKAHQTVRQAMVAELCEETLINEGGIDSDTIEKSISSCREFDDPYRDPRGRVITHAFHVNLKSKRKLPKVKGADDAEWSGWIPLSQLQRDMMFADHHEIIQYFTGYPS